jgi:hypothetical protein
MVTTYRTIHTRLRDWFIDKMPEVKRQLYLASPVFVAEAVSVISNRKRFDGALACALFLLTCSFFLVF